MSAEPTPPRDHTALLARFERLCRDDHRIVAGFLSGSLAREEADRYSDIDLGVLTSADGYDDVRAERPRLVEQLGEPLFVEDFGDDANIFFVLADGTEGELLVAQADRVDALNLGAYRVLVGDAGIADSGVLPIDAADRATLAEELDAVLRWFWHDLSHFVAAIGRVQLWWAAGQLQALRASCVNLVRIEHGLEAQEEPYEKLDTAISVSDLDQLRSTFAPLERGAMLEAGTELVSFFRERAPRVASAYAVTYPERLAATVSARLDELSASKA